MPLWDGSKARKALANEDDVFADAGKYATDHAQYRANGIE
jgi:hypothetical protein